MGWCCCVFRRMVVSSCFGGISNNHKSFSTTNTNNNIVFMGSPQVSTLVLDKLLDDVSSEFQVAAIVTQPPSKRERGRKMLPSPVAQRAIERGFPPHLIFTPQKPSNQPFLSDLKALNPSLCVTAAYGNILPTNFLSIPLHGTVNIHPSLLPLYRGASPVQRALQDGVEQTGVSLAFTVRALDAGPIIATDTVQVDHHVNAPQLLELLFRLGSGLLIDHLPSIFDGSAKLKAQPQDDSRATFAPKLTTEESWLSFDQEASILHNKVRAFAGWPGTRAKIEIVGPGSSNIVDVKIISTRFCSHHNVDGASDEITFSEDAILFPCSSGSALQVMEIQLPGKKVMSARDFWNGVRGQKLKISSNEKPPTQALSTMAD